MLKRTYGRLRGSEGVREREYEERIGAENMKGLWPRRGKRDISPMSVEFVRKFLLMQNVQKK